MIGIVLGITLPIVYIVIGSAVGTRIYAKGIEPECKRSIANGGGHKEFHIDCEMGAILGGIGWPLAPLVLLGRRIGTGKRIFGFRARKAEKIAKRIADMEREIGIGA